MSKPASPVQAGNEGGYALVAVLFLVVFLALMGAIISENVTSSQNLVTSSENIVIARAKAEEKVLVKTAKIQNKVTQTVKEANLKKDDDTSRYIEISDLQAAVQQELNQWGEPGDNIVQATEDQIQVSLIAKSTSGKIEQTAHKVIAFSFTAPTAPSEPESLPNHYAASSWGKLHLNGASRVNGNLYASESVEVNTSNGKPSVNGMMYAPKANFDPGTWKDQFAIAPDLVTKADPPVLIDPVQKIKELKSKAEKALALSNATPQDSTIPENNTVPQNNCSIPSGWISGSYICDKSVILKGSDMMLLGSSITINGDLIVQGALMMESQDQGPGKEKLNPSIKVTGSIYVFGTLKGTGNIEVGSDQVIYVGGINPGQEDGGSLHLYGSSTVSGGGVYVTVSKEPTSQFVIEGTLTTKNSSPIPIYANSLGETLDPKVVVKNLTGENNFKLYSEGGVKVENSPNTATLNGGLYSNKSLNISAEDHNLTINGFVASKDLTLTSRNNKLTINNVSGTGGSGPLKPAVPSSNALLYFNEQRTSYK